MKTAFQNKTVLITGATSGIGAVVAHELAGLGAKVVVSGRREAEGHVVVAAISKAGGKASFFKGDTSREADMKALVEFAVKSYGGLNYAFNNAGVEGEMGVNSDQQTEENYRRTFDINVLGVVLSMKYELPAILASGGGAIVNTTSVAGSRGLPGAGVYVASKHAVIGLTRTAALEFAQKGIRVNAVAPGTIQTPMIDRLVGSQKENNPQRDWLLSKHPIGRFGKPEEVSSVVISLLENPFVTGAVLPVDGGWLAQ
jgi:NAD(P)-dependent dehydrogenase (short-subunit alcohol dehydrogenase family)